MRIRRLTRGSGKAACEWRQQGGGHRSRHPVRSVLQRTCRIRVCRKWMAVRRGRFRTRFCLRSRRACSDRRSTGASRCGGPSSADLGGSSYFARRPTRRRVLSRGEPGPKAAVTGFRKGRAWIFARPGVERQRVRAPARRTRAWSRLVHRQARCGLLRDEAGRVLRVSLWRCADGSFVKRGRVSLARTYTAPGLQGSEPLARITAGKGIRQNGSATSGEGLAL